MVIRTDQEAEAPERAVPCVYLAMSLALYLLHKVGYIAIHKSGTVRGAQRNRVKGPVSPQLDAIEAESRVTVATSVMKPPSRRRPMPWKSWASPVVRNSRRDSRGA